MCCASLSGRRPAHLFQSTACCFDGLFAESEDAVTSQQLFPTKGGALITDLNTVNVISHFKGFTATRMRNRGLWVRPNWTAVENGRFATNRESVTLVSSGGTDGNAPGVWSLLTGSVLVGLSMNNVDRCCLLNSRNARVVSGSIVALEVTSPPRPRSSARTRLMKSIRSKVAGSGMSRV